jgi:hypothetical protein
MRYLSSPQPHAPCVQHVIPNVAASGESDVACQSKQGAEVGVVNHFRADLSATKRATLDPGKLTPDFSESRQVNAFTANTAEDGPSARHSEFQTSSAVLPISQPDHIQFRTRLLGSEPPTFLPVMLIRGIGGQKPSLGVSAGQRYPSTFRRSRESIGVPAWLPVTYSDLLRDIARIR